MKNRIKVLGMMCCAAFMAVAAVHAEDVGQMTGAYETYEKDGMTEEAQEAFDLAMENFEGGENYTAVQLVETQLVAGMNYRILCDVKTEDEKIHKKLITVYKDLDGNCEVTMEQKVIMPKQDGGILDRSEFSVKAGFTTKDFNWDEKTLRFDAYQTAYYDMYEMATAECGSVIYVDGRYITIDTIEEGDTIRRTDEGREEKAATRCINKDQADEHMFVANEGGTWVAPTWNDHLELVKLGEKTLPISEQLVFTDHTSDPGESVDIPFQDLQSYMADQEANWEESYGPYNTEMVVEGGEIVSIVSRWMP